MFKIDLKKENICEQLTADDQKYSVKKTLSFNWQGRKVAIITSICSLVLAAGVGAAAIYFFPVMSTPALYGLIVIATTIGTTMTIKFLAGNPYKLMREPDYINSLLAQGASGEKTEGNAPAEKNIKVPNFFVVLALKIQMNWIERKTEIITSAVFTLCAVTAGVLAIHFMSSYGFIGLAAMSTIAAGGSLGFTFYHLMKRSQRPKPSIAPRVEENTQQSSSNTNTNSSSNSTNNDSSGHNILNSQVVNNPVNRKFHMPRDVFGTFFAGIFNHYGLKPRKDNLTAQDVISEGYVLQNLNNVIKESDHPNAHLSYFKGIISDPDLAYSKLSTRDRIMMTTKFTDSNPGCTENDLKKELFGNLAFYYLEYIDKHPLENFDTKNTTITAFGVKSLLRAYIRAFTLGLNNALDFSKFYFNGFGNKMDKEMSGLFCEFFKVVSSHSLEIHLEDNIFSDEQLNSIFKSIYDNDALQSWTIYLDERQIKMAESLEYFQKINIEKRAKLSEESYEFNFMIAGSVAPPLYNPEYDGALDDDGIPVADPAGNYSDYLGTNQLYFPEVPNSNFSDLDESPKMLTEPLKSV